MSPDALRSILFVPATRPERIAKAWASEADAVIVDLEDAVAESDKAAARESLDTFLNRNPQARILVRVNAPGTQHYEPDLALCSHHDAITHLVIPKTESCQSLEAAAACHKPLWPLIETARGLLALPALVYASGVERLSFGALDMCAELGLEPGTPGAQQILDQSRYALLVHSLAAGLLPPVESVHPSIEDTAAVGQVAKRAKEMGFSGMLCIHPKQLSPINQAFTPSEAEVAWARRVMEGADQHGGAFSIEGQMVDAPVVARAQRIIAKAKGGTS
ncbi:HpcH/HpaI aldolase/citrate lyase family protein [Halomonas sp. WWR20]